jgi:hypothetical protein
MLTLNVTNRIIMKITVWLIPTRQRFDNCLLKKFNYTCSNRIHFYDLKNIFGQTCEVNYCRIKFLMGQNCGINVNETLTPNGTLIVI